MDDGHSARRHDDGRKVFIVGPVERWILGVAAAAVVTMMYGYGSSVMRKLDIVSNSASRIEIAQAVTTNDINEIKAKQSLMQQEVSKIPRLELKTDTNAADLQELKQARHLK